MVNTISERNNKKLQLLKNQYPLFEFGVDSIKDDTMLAYTKYSKTSKQYFNIDNGRIEVNILHRFDDIHCLLAMSKDLMTRYPNLYISCYKNSNGIDVSAWVNRNNDDAESIGSIDIVNIGFNSIMQKWDTEAKKAKQEGWFFCSGHQKAHPITKYGYFYFAGKYCKQWQVEHPEYYKSACNESYE